MVKGRELLKRALGRHKLTQSQLAAALGVNRALPCRWLKGQAPSMRLAAELERRYGVPMRAWT